MKKQVGMIVGQKGVKYGLQTRKPGPTAVPGGQKPPAVFGGDSDSEEETVGAQVQRQAYAKKSDTKVQDMLTKALEDDPNVFDYDAAIENDRAAEAAGRGRGGASTAQRQATAAVVARQPRYITSILEQAQQRKREQDLIMERRLLKDRQKEDHLYQNEEKFVTAAYRKKLEEDRKWQEQQKKRDKEEEAADPSKLGNMNLFYANLLTKNVAMGQATKEPEKDEPGPTSSGKDRAGDGAKDRSAEEDSDGEARRQEEEAPRRRAMEGLSEYERLRLLAEEARVDEGGRGVSEEPGRDGSSGRRGGGEGGSHDEGAAHPGSRGQAAQQHVDDGDHQQQQQQQQQDQQQVAAGGKRRNDDSTISAARERYLARKRQKG